MQASKRTVWTFVLVAFVTQVTGIPVALAQEQMRWGDLKAQYNEQIEIKAPPPLYGDWGFPVYPTTGIPIGMIEDAMAALPALTRNNASIGQIAIATGSPTYELGVFVINDAEDRAEYFAYDADLEAETLVAYVIKNADGSGTLFEGGGLELAEVVDGEYHDLQAGAKINTQLICNIATALGAGFGCYGFGFLPGGLLWVLGCSLLFGWIGSYCS